jgi:hypothetical protein
MEQLPDVRLRRRGLGKSELSGMAAQDKVFRLAVTTHSKPANEWGTRPKTGLLAIWEFLFLYQ